jgi:beta-N-acetylhexosaminidase
VEALVATGKPVVLVATRNPYDIAPLTQVPGYIASYSWTRPAMQAVARAVIGKLNPVGRLPVRIPAADDPNATLYPYGHGLGF